MSKKFKMSPILEQNHPKSPKKKYSKSFTTPLTLLRCKRPKFSNRNKNTKNVRTLTNFSVKLFIEFEKNTQLTLMRLKIRKFSDKINVEKIRKFPLVLSKIGRPIRKKIRKILQIP